MNTELDDHFMRRTFTLLKPFKKPPSPNPSVACLIVKNRQIIGKGVHLAPGSPHAEIIALRTAGVFAKGADVYVNLEPCCHHGRTPPCVNALIKAGVKRVICAMTDPNPLVKGRGILALHDHGIVVVNNVCNAQACHLNRFFVHFIQHKKPFVIAKWAMSLDGKMITAKSDKRQLSNKQSIKQAHAFRQKVDAILIGSETAIQDNPMLTTRYQDSGTTHHPLRIVLDSRARLPTSLTLLTGQLPGKTLVVTTNKAKPNWIKRLRERGNQVWVLPTDDEQHISLVALLDKLGEHNIMSLLVEGGAICRDAFFNEGLVNEVHSFISPHIIASLAHKQTLEKISSDEFKQDHFFQFSMENTL
jgi:diaminohydroxyphosphoribosylaminopyrimidine deaminase / 5-amino-6-(5-phosphoribosylamino)uracil reductase